MTRVLVALGDEMRLTEIEREGEERDGGFRVKRWEDANELSVSREFSSAAQQQSCQAVTVDDD